jgi:lauroyl/myristoyl acyltransferase
MAAHSDRPLFTFADLSEFAYAYPLSGMARRFPGPTVWAVKTVAAPCRRWMRRSEQRQVAERMCLWLDIPPREAEVLAARWMNHVIRHNCYELATLSGKNIESRVEVAGLEHLDRALTGGRGVLLFTMHSFAMKPARRRLRQMGYPMLTVERFSIPHNLGRLGRRWLGPRLGRLRDRMYAEAGTEVVSARDAGCALRIARRLREGGIAETAVDIRGSKTSVVVPFLNGRQTVSDGVLDLARLCGCPVLSLTATYSTDGVRLEIGEPLPCLELPALVREMERQVRAYPDQWTGWFRRSPAT